MFSTADTIVAIATPPGRAALGIIRLSGPESQRIACALLGRRQPLVPRHATIGRVEIAGRAIDHAVATFFPAPRSYTTDDLVELTLHGSPIVLESAVAAALAAGARLARPGEFTFRAYVNGRIDLTEAEAVADLIDAQTIAQAQAAFDQLDGSLARVIRDLDARVFDLAARLEASLDFPEEGYHFGDAAELARDLAAIAHLIRDILSASARGRLLRDGAAIVVSGRPNTGKSSLFNKLLGHARAIVTSAAGTTRDVLIESFDLNGAPVRLLDTAGVRAAEEPAEIEGVTRASEAIEAADLVLLVVDRSVPLQDQDRTLLRRTSNRPRVVAANKVDLPAAWDPAALEVPEVVCTSALTGEGIDALRARLTGVLSLGGDLTESPGVTNVRHIDLLNRAHDALERAIHLCSASAPEEIVLIEIHDARSHLESITRSRTSDDVLERIFERFCIGK
jgi:tRNA modification GTPase